MGSACDRGSSWARAALLLALAVTSTSAQNLIINGSMDGPVGFDILPAGWDHAPPSSNTFDAASTFFQMAWSPSANGGTFAHSAGLTNTCCQSEGLSQTVTGLIPGATYQLTFEQSAMWWSLWSIDPFAYWEVTFGAQVQNSTLVAQPQTQGTTIPWQGELMQFTASAPTQVLRFAARDDSGAASPFLTAQLGLDRVELCQLGLCGGAPGQWLYTVGDDNVLRGIDLDGCNVTPVGVTQDTPSGPVRRIRGLTFVSTISSLLGITREGDLLRVDPYTATTTRITSLPFGNPGTEFWGGLCFDGVETLYTANATDARELVAVKVGPFTSTLVGSTQTSGGTPRQILGLDILPATAPSLVPGPVHGLLYGSDRTTGALVRIDTNTAVVTDVGGGLGLGAQQAIAFHPFSGTLFGLDDQGGGAADLTTFDFGGLTGNLHCGLPFDIVEQGGLPDFGWGGLAFTRPGSWSDQGCALAGVFGDPLLVGTGSMAPGTPQGLELSDAAPSANSLLILALSSTPVPFVGGVLKPFPFLPPIPIALPPTGGLQLTFTLPPGWPSGTELWAQWAVQDVTAVLGVALSNAVVGVVP